MICSPGVQFWQPVPDMAAELVGAYFEAIEPPAHVHEEWQFGVLERPSKLSLGAYRRHSVQVDDVTMVAPYEVHTEGGQLGATPKWRMLYITPSAMDRLLGRDVSRFRQPVVTDPAAAARLRELLTLSCDGRIGGTAFLGDVRQWLQQLLARHAEHLPSSRSVPAVEHARAYLQQRPTQAVTVSELAAIAGTTTSYLARSFSRIMGLPPRSYHAQVRLAHARRLLAEGRSVTWVAYECGFADQSHLSRRFKECHGLAPGAFQAQYRAGSSAFAAA